MTKKCKHIYSANTFAIKIVIVEESYDATSNLEVFLLFKVYVFNGQGGKASGGDKKREGEKCYNSRIASIRSLSLRVKCASIDHINEEINNLF